jgi:hypothetical protein
VSETHSGEKVAPGAAEVSTDTPGPDYAPPLLSVDQQGTGMTADDVLYRAVWDAFYAYDGDEENATQQANILFGTTYLTNAVAARDQAAERRGGVRALRRFADTRGVQVGDEDDEWWQGYRQAQRECLHDASDAADRIEAES